jgi:hypothetical protein
MNEPIEPLQLAAMALLRPFPNIRLALQDGMSARVVNSHRIRDWLRTFCLSLRRTSHFSCAGFPLGRRARGAGDWSRGSMHLPYNTRLL